MEIVFLVLLIMLLAALVFLGLQLLRLMFQSKRHATVSLAFFGLVILVMGVNHIFFKNMEFIPSQVYPDLYLVKNPIKDKNKLNTAIKEFVVENVNNIKGNGQDMMNYSLRFYKYQKSWGINLFADAGTAYFLENEEDPSGFVVEELSMYRRYLLAQFHQNPCKNAADYFCGELVFYDEGEVTKTEFLTDKHNDPVEK